MLQNFIPGARMLKFSRHNGEYVEIFATKWRVCWNFCDKMACMLKFLRQNGLFMGFVLEDTILTCQYTTKLTSFNCLQVHEGSKLSIFIHGKISLKYHDIFWILQYRDISKWCNILHSWYIAIQNAHPCLECFWRWNLFYLPLGMLL